MYAKLKGSGESQAAYAEKLEDDDAVMKAVSCAHMAESFKFDLMGAVVALIVALAGGLALVVLFTLANTNVSERERRDGHAQGARILRQRGSPLCEP